MKEILKNKKVKKILSYVICIIISLYISYLIIRVNSFGNRINIIITMFFVIVSVLLLRIFVKKIKYQNIEIKKLKIIFLISLIISLGILVTNFDFFAKKYIDTTVVITNLDEKNQTAKGNNVTIRQITIDNVVQNLGEINFTNGWSYDENTGLINCSTPNSEPLILSFAKAKNIEIIFDKNDHSGFVNIKDGEQEEKQDLYSFTDKLQRYEVQSNRIMSFFSIVRAIVSFCILTVLAYIFCVASYYTYKKKKSLLLPVLAIIGITRIAFYGLLQPYVLFPDSDSYMDSSYILELMHLNLRGRTPVYPIIISFCKIIFGTQYFINFVVYIQMIISFISVIYLYKTLKLLIKREILISFITILFGISLAVIGWDTCILTESFALSGTTIFIYLVIKYLKTGILRYGITSTILIFILTFLRPSALGFMGILFVFFIIRLILNKETRKIDIKCLISSVITIIITVIYAAIFYTQYGIFSISDAVPRQQLFICADQDWYKDSSNREFVEHLENSLQEQGEIWAGMKQTLFYFKSAKIQELTNECKEKNSAEYKQYIINTITENSNENYNAYHLFVPNSKVTLTYAASQSFLILKMIHVYIITFIQLVIGLYKWIRYKKVPWIDLGLFAFMFTTLFTTFVGTNAEFMRTSLCVLPFAYISIALYINSFINIERKLIKEK